MPSEVDANVTFLKVNGIWHRVSENPPVRSCAEAARYRMRLGHRGIPLFDELKSSVGKYTDDSGENYVAIHCRGDQHLDEIKLSDYLCADFRRLDISELSAGFDTEYGRVNPVGLFRAKPHMRQVFDASLLEPCLPPFTMMTNLGSFYYAFEFRMRELIDAIETAEVADVVQEAGMRLPKAHKYGILTGNSPESGILLWQHINKGIRERLGADFRGDVSFPAVTIESEPLMGVSMELAAREHEVRSVVLAGIQRLCDGGATTVAIACNTTQYFTPEVSEFCRKRGVQFVSMASVLADYLAREGIDSFDFLGIGAVADFEKWSGFGAALREFEVSTPSSSELSDISDLAYKVKKEVVTGNTINKVRQLIKSVTKTSTVVIALTELSILVLNQKSKQRSSKRYIDTLEVLANSMVEHFIADVTEYQRVSRGDRTS